MEQNSTMQERITQMYKYAYSSEKVKSKQDFAEKAGITRELLSRFFSGKAEPSRKTLAAINSALGSPFNEAWMLTGEGEMMATTTTPASGDSIHLLITEMREQRIAKDAQIDRLLNIIEQMQK